MKDEHILRIENMLGIEFPEEQVDIIMHNGTPKNVISCAGSGKTTIMIATLLYMQLKYDINPLSICVISFNRTAVDEIQERYNKSAIKLGLPTDKITFKTFHALYLMVLRFFNKDLKVAGEGQASALFNRAFYEKSKDKSDACREDIYRLRGFALNNMISSTKKLFNNPTFVMSNASQDDYMNVIKAFNAFKEEEDLKDFDDLQYAMYNLLKENEKAREMVNNAWDYWFIDEYQDISKIQSEILKMSVKDTNNLVTIGDEDQCIYEFRGSKVGFILDFPIFYPHAKRFIMDYNYRCPSVILEKAEALINHNNKRIQKKMKAHKKGGKLVLTGHDSPMYTAMEIARRIAEDYENGVPLSEIAVLYRNNSQQLFIVDQLVQLAIPAKVNKDSNLLHNHMFVDDIMRIIDLAANETDPYAFRDVFYKVCKNMSKNEVSRISKLMLTTGDSYKEFLNDSQLRYTEEIVQTLDDIKICLEEKSKMPVILGLVMDIYKVFVDFMANGTRMTPAEAEDVINYLYFIAADKSYRQFKYYLERAKSIITLDKENNDAVTITTMHTVKGLEYDNVYLVDVSSDIIPNESRIEKLVEEFGKEAGDDAIEQERRLMYVACTRAKKKLHITYCNGRESQFLREMLGEEYILGGDTIVIE